MCCFGEENPDKTFYVIRWDSNGSALMGLLNYVLAKIDYANRNGWIPVVDFQNGKNYYFQSEKDVGTYNVWEKFFEQVSRVSLDEVYRSKRVVLGGVDLEAKSPLTEINLTALHEKQNNYEHWKELCNAHIRPCGAVQKVVEQMQNSYGKLDNVLGVKLRGTDYNPPPPGHYYQPSIEMAIEGICDIQKKWKSDKLILSTEDSEIQERLKKEFGTNITCLPDDLLNMGNKEGEKSVIEEGQLYLAELLFLAHCPYVVGGINGGLLGIVLLSEHIRELKTWDLGKAK